MSRRSYNKDSEGELLESKRGFRDERVGSAVGLPLLQIRSVCDKCRRRHDQQERLVRSYVIYPILGLTIAACGGPQTDIGADAGTSGTDSGSGEPEALLEEDRLNDEGVESLSGAEFTDAVIRFDAALYENPDHVPARTNRAIARLALDEHAGALEDASIAALTDPEDGRAVLNLALTQAHLGFWDQAAETSARIVDDPEFGEDALQVRAVALTLSGNHSAASAAFDDLIDAVGETADVLNNRAILAEETDSLDEAFDLYSRALDESPDHLDALRNRGMLLLRLGRQEEAAGDLERYLELVADDRLDRPVIEGHLETLEESE